MYNSYKKQQKLHESWRKYLKEEAPSISKMQPEIADYQERGCMGITSFTILSWIFLHETFSLKTAVCLVLSATIMILQIFWK